MALLFRHRRGCSKVEARCRIACVSNAAPQISGMPTALRAAGFRFVVYPNDHPPAHIHVLGPGWSVVVTLHGPALREVVGPCTERDARRVLALVEAHRAVLMDAWRRIHG